MSNTTLEKTHGSQWCSTNKFRFSSQALEELKKKLGFTQAFRLIGILSIKQLTCSSVAILQRSYSLLMKEMYRQSLWRNGIWEALGQSSQDKPDCYEHIHPRNTSLDIPSWRTSTLHPCMLQISYKEFVQLLSLVSTKAWKGTAESLSVLYTAQLLGLLAYSFPSQNRAQVDMKIAYLSQRGVQNQ